MPLLRLLIAVLVTAFATPALAAGCFPIAERSDEARIWQAGWQTAALPGGATVEITFIGHSSFLIETAGGMTAVTDYHGRAPVTPVFVTMNNAHGTHYTTSPDPGIRHVLRGWNPAGGWAEHDVSEGDLRVRNIPTAVHGRYGADELSNSIFVFETPDLCIAHLGHLHHLLTPEQVGELGQIDILLVPIDGLYTMGQELMIEVIEQIRPAVVIPMHYFGSNVLGRFAALVEEKWEVVMSESASIALSRASLPYQQVLVLPGY
jgi:L-ascorbate metabolism protein UlaG (beta-lactamase superfamily)